RQYLQLALQHLEAFQLLAHTLGCSKGGEQYREQLVEAGCGEDARYRCPKVNQAVEMADHARRVLDFCEPFAVCPCCHHVGKVDPTCRFWAGHNWVTLSGWNTAPAEHRLAELRAAAKGGEG